VNIYMPSQGVEDWKKLLIEPDKQWKKGYSARTLAYCWENSNGLPLDLEHILTEEEKFKDIKPILIIPEHKVALPPAKGRPSQNDVWVLGKSSEELVSIAVEGKVSEPFGPTLEEWKPSSTKGKIERYEFLKKLLNLDDKLPTTLRYQLLHRTASAILEAKRFNAKYAIMLVHSFSQGNEWFDDYRAFANLYGVNAEVNKLHYAGHVSGKKLYLGWVKGDKKFLEM